MTTAMRDRGFTVLELLLGLSLGLTVLGLALSVWQTSQQSALALTAQQNLHHNARVAVEAILQQAELAGAAQLVRVPNSLGVIAETDTTTTATDAGLLDVDAVDNPKGGDSLVLAHWRSLSDTDCQGNHNGSAASIRNQFQRSTSTTHDFACKDLLASGSTYQALAEGVEDMQIEVAEVTPDSQKLQWKTPSQVTQWARVVAIEVCLRMVSPARVTAARAFSLGCQDEAVPADGHLRLLVRRTVQVRRHEAFNS